MTLAKLRTRSRVKGLKTMKIKCWLCLSELDTETDYMVISPSTGEKCLFYCEKCGTFTTDPVKERGFEKVFHRR